MAIEVSCGQCSGRLLIEAAGVVVACPHCGVHLSIPVPEFDAPAPPLAASADDRVNLSTSGQTDSTSPLMNADESHPVNSPNTPYIPESSRAETMIASGSHDLIRESLPDTEHPSSIFSTAENVDLAPEVLEGVGWPSSPNLSLVNEPASVAQPPSAKPEPPPELPPTLPIVHVDAVELPITQFPNGETQTDPPVFSWVTEEKSSLVPELTLPFSFGNPAVENSRPDTVDGPVESSWTTPTVAPSLVDSQAVAPTSPFMGVKTEESEFPTTFSGNSWGESIGVTQVPANDQSPMNVLGALGSHDIDGVGSQKLSSVDHVSKRGVEVQQAVDSRNAFLMMLLILVGSYASLTTIYLIYTLIFGRAHQLESLPDLKTVQQQGGRAAVPRHENDLPSGHDLRLGQTERFGNIRVTPLRVTRGAIAFLHQSGDTTQERSPSDPVLKLWLKIENLSPTQTIAPLDTTLMFFRRDLDGRIASYNVIFRNADRRQKKAQVYYPFDRMAVDTEWLIVGQHTNEALAPNQTYETFVPSQEHLDDLTGELVWRVHFRKGYGPVTGNGVTTLIDVHFNSDDVSFES